mmetsp:Transcript_4357/g.6123  ORF Transcript_4357/g.6123 Transcript_4357/m.6123 type:complete len:207 (+) Transcript_4357:72-692(+)
MTILQQNPGSHRSGCVDGSHSHHVLSFSHTHALYLFALPSSQCFDRVSGIRTGGQQEDDRCRGFHLLVHGLYGICNGLCVLGSHHWKPTTMLINEVHLSDKIIHCQERAIFAEAPQNQQPIEIIRHIFEVGNSRLKNGDGELLGLVAVVPRQKCGLIALNVFHNGFEHWNCGTQLQDVQPRFVAHPLKRFRFRLSYIQRAASTKKQ